MMFYRYLILITVTLLSSFYSGAQDNNFVSKDTTVLSVDAVETPETERVQYDEEAQYDEFTADTLLTGNQLYVDSDSVMVLKKAKAFAYAKNLDSLLRKYQEDQETNAMSAGNKISWLDRILFSSGTVLLFWMLAALFVLFVLYKLFFTQGFFQRSYTKTNVSELVDEPGNLSPHTDYGKLIGQAVNSGNYRLAVRYHYLQTLQKLSAAGAIQFAADKTNYQYINELTGKGYKKAFVSLTLHYEYVWYGEFLIDLPVFNDIQLKFKQFNSAV